jgi:predicted thioesterase
MGKAAGNSAVNFSPDTAPAVLATSRLCEVMEMAAARRMHMHVGDGESSVAVETNLSHVASPHEARGMLRAVASQHRICGRMHRFIIHAFDERGLIAVCEHTRAVVNRKRFVARAQRRAGRASMLLEI